MPPPPPPPRLVRLAGVAAPAAAASRFHRPALPGVAFLVLGCRCRRSEGPWRTTTNRRRWWSDEEEEEEEEEEYGGGESVFDEPWFSKVFRAYGFVLPVLLASMLVATGPKAFLMAMALPLAQSAISWAISAFSGRQQRSYPYEYDSDSDDPAFQQQQDEDTEEEDGARARATQWQRQQSKQGNGGGGFGGWDDYDMSTRKWSDTAAAAQFGLRTRRRRGRSNGSMASGWRGSSRQYKQAPLLARLLVALFPFLGSWFRVL
ncbi:hypothetical protein ABZP36_014957 [Zizania latifolia]